MADRNWRCRLGFHREIPVEAFPIDSRNPVIVGVECEHCHRVRCVSYQSRPTMNDRVKLAFDQAHAWQEKKTGQRVIGTFVHFR